MSHTLKLPLSLRLYQTIRFNRPIDPETDYISPGGYTLRMRCEDGSEKSLEMDFYESEGGMDDKNRCLARFMQKDLMFDEYLELQTITEYMLRHIEKVEEWYIYTGEPGESDLKPVAIEGAYFEITGDGSCRDFPPIRIPVTVPITL